MPKTTKYGKCDCPTHVSLKFGAHTSTRWPYEEVTDERLGGFHTAGRAAFKQRQTNGNILNRSLKTTRLDVNGVWS